MPVTTGITAQTQLAPVKTPQGEPSVSFREILERTQDSQKLAFSKHAAVRVAQREIELSESGMERLNEGVQIAREKGMDDALIMMDGSAFIVSAKNGTVITALNSRELSGRAITNIDGTVIL